MQLYAALIWLFCRETSYCKIQGKKLSKLKLKAIYHLDESEDFFFWSVVFLDHFNSSKATADIPGFI